MTNLDIWQTYVGEQSPEEFMRAYGSADPEVCLARFLEDRGNLYGIVNQGAWRDTFQAADQHHVHTVRMYLMSYLEETRDEWGPALEAKRPSIPRRYREKFDQDKYPPPPPVENTDVTAPSADETAPDLTPENDASAAQTTADATDASLPEGDALSDAAGTPDAEPESATPPGDEESPDDGATPTA
ncbi:MAG: hypothetical protein KF886_26135 [Candidatus Hydrogenedentes bacterium]|nr:hypothetical protein [Candidatus Hydrogenedentota bacterium]